MDNSKLIRQGGVPVGYMDGKTAVLDYDFWGCAIGKRLMQTGCAVRWQSGVAKQLNAEESGREKGYRRRGAVRTVWRALCFRLHCGV